MNSEFMPVLVVFAAIGAVGWVIIRCGDLWQASKEKAIDREFERLMNQSHEARVAYHTLEAETRTVLRQMGLKEITLTFFA